MAIFREVLNHVDVQEFIWPYFISLILINYFGVAIINFYVSIIQFFVLYVMSDADLVF